MSIFLFKIQKESLYTLIVQCIKIGKDFANCFPVFSGNEI